MPQESWEVLGWIKGIRATITVLVLTQAPVSVIVQEQQFQTQSEECTDWQVIVPSWGERKAWGKGCERRGGGRERSGGIGGGGGCN